MSGGSGSVTKIWPRWGRTGTSSPSGARNGRVHGSEGDDKLVAAHVALRGADPDDAALGRPAVAAPPRAVAGDTGETAGLGRADHAVLLDQQGRRRRVLTDAGAVARGGQREGVAEQQRVDLAVHRPVPSAERVVGEEGGELPGLVAIEPLHRVAELLVGEELLVDLVLVGVALEHDLQRACLDVLDVDAGRVGEFLGQPRPELSGAVVVVDERRRGVDGRVQQAAIAAARALADVAGLEQQHVGAALGELVGDGRAGRAGAEHDDVARRGQRREQVRHALDDISGCGPAAMTRRPGPEPPAPGALPSAGDVAAACRLALG